MAKTGILVQTPSSEIFATLEIFDKFGVTRKDLGKIRRDKGKARQIAKLIRSGEQRAGGIYEVIVDYDETLTQMIKAGNYDWIDGDINNKHFPVQGTGQHEVKLVLVNFEAVDVTTEVVLKELFGSALAPAKVEHLLALGAAYPKSFRLLLSARSGLMRIAIAASRIWTARSGPSSVSARTMMTISGVMIGVFLQSVSRLNKSKT